MKYYTSGHINTAIGLDTVTTGSPNIAIGFQECNRISALPAIRYKSKLDRPFKSSFRPSIDPLKNTDRSRLEEFEEVKKLDEVTRKI